MQPHKTHNPGRGGSQRTERTVAELFSHEIVFRPGEQVVEFGAEEGKVSANWALQTGAGNSHFVALTTLVQHSLRQAFFELGLPEPHLIDPADTSHPAEGSSGSRDLDGMMDRALIWLPKGRKLARRWLCQGYEALKTGGTLLLAGANDAGIQTVIKDGQALFGNGSVLSYHKGCRLVRLVKDAPEEMVKPGWASEAGIRAGSYCEFDVPLPEPERVLRLESLPGVFAYDELDQGTALLLEHLLEPDKTLDGKTVLDFGCGYGIIGLWAALKGAKRVDLVDVNLMAVACARRNLRRHGLQAVEVLAGDRFEPVKERQYDLIVSNPPFHTTGQAVDYTVARDFIAQARQHLSLGGKLVLVANRFIRYERLMREVFGNAQRRGETGRFHVWEASKISA